MTSHELERAQEIASLFQIPLYMLGVGHLRAVANIHELEVFDDDRWGIEWRCGAYDTSPDRVFCTLEADHETNYWHADVRNGTLWAGWRGPFNGHLRQPHQTHPEPPW